MLSQFNSLRQAVLASHMLIDLQISGGITTKRLCQKCIPAEPSEDKRNGKVTITDRRYGREKMNVIKAKKASVVMKNLNYENCKIFGRVITGSTVSSGRKWYSARDLLSPDKKIQDETIIPIIDQPETLKSSLASKTEKYSQSFDVDNNSTGASCPNVLDVILGFPLLNMTIPGKKVITDNYINQANYLRKHLLSVCENKLPSVTKVLEKTMPPESVAALEQWKLQMIEKMGIEAFEEYQARLLSTGSSLHEIIVSFLFGRKEEDLQIKPENNGHWNSIKRVLKDVRDYDMIEEPVSHPFLAYRGIVDCLAEYRNCFVAIEWKTSKKQKSTLSGLYDYPLQLAAYVGALNFDPRYHYMVRNGLIVIAYEEGSPASVHFINQNLLQRYWNEWLKRLKLFYEMK